ncbi:MAG: hypothetical protein IAE94_06295 [Chthoniobacterales bacterium]|nr:hypothetical protein [Chthoniobacterales bacterium]
MAQKKFRRQKDQLSDTLKTFSSLKAIWHLFGNSMQHAIDVLRSEVWQNKQNRKELLKKIPKPLHRRIESLIAQVAKYAQGLDVAGKTSLHAAGFTPPQTPCEALTILDLEKGRFGAEAGKLVFNLAHMGKAGSRQWKEVAELEWEQFCKGEMDYRSYFVYASSRRHMDPSKGGKPELWNLYARLTPWMAKVVGEKLESMGDEGKRALQEVLTKLAGELGTELGVDVVGLAVHREKDGDLHVHFIFSLTREKPVEKDIAKREFEALISATARRRKEAGEKMGFKKLRKLVREDLTTQGAHQVKFFERQRRDFLRPIRVLGPSFLGKLALWEASGRNPEIAALGDRPEWEANTFRGRVVAAVKNGEDLGVTCIDYWLTCRYQQEIEALLTSEEKARCAELGRQAAERYRKTGSQTPSVENYIAMEVAKLEQNLPDQVRKDLEKKAKELDEREDAVSVRERAVDSNLPVWLIELLDRLPKRMRKKTEKATVENVFLIVESLSKARKELANALLKITTMKLEELRSIIRKVALLLRVEIPKEKKIDDPEM